MNKSEIISILNNALYAGIVHVSVPFLGWFFAKDNHQSFLSNIVTLTEPTLVIIRKFQRNADRIKVTASIEVTMIVFGQISGEILNGVELVKFFDVKELEECFSIDYTSDENGGFSEEHIVVDSLEFLENLRGEN